MCDQPENYMFSMYALIKEKKENLQVRNNCYGENITSIPAMIEMSVDWQ